MIYQSHNIYSYCLNALIKPIHYDQSTLSIFTPEYSIRISWHTTHIAAFAKTCLPEASTGPYPNLYKEEYEREYSSQYVRTHVGLSRGKQTNACPYDCRRVSLQKNNRDNNKNSYI